MRRLKGIVRSIINSTGYDMHKLAPGSTPSLQLLRALRHFDIDVVLDVGANIGQFANELRHVGFDGSIVSFEPLSSAHRELSRAARGTSNWAVHSRCAIGDRDGTTAINVSTNSVSSSIFPMLDAHLLAAPESAFISTESTPIFKLDSVASRYLTNDSRPFLKIDTQGYEWQVLDGAPATISKAIGVLCELSVVPLYEGQRLWTDLIDRLKREGFSLWAIQQGFVDARNGRTLQLDGIFFRERPTATNDLL